MTKLAPLWGPEALFCGRYPITKQRMAMATLEKSVYRERLKTELREFLVLATYLFICFAALAAYKAAILRVYGVTFAPWVFAAVKALVSAKFLLIGRMFGLGDGLARKYPLIISTLYRSFTFVVLAFLTVLEELVMGTFAGNQRPLRWPALAAAHYGK